MHTLRIQIQKYASKLTTLKDKFNFQRLFCKKSKKKVFWFQTFTKKSHLF